jgi:hypothetical protein
MGATKFSGWKYGMDNIHQPHDLPDGTLRRAVNVDVSDSGKLRRRRGFSPTLSAAGAHSLWGDRAGNGYFVAADTLKRLNLDGTAAVIGAVATGSNPLSFEEAGSAIYFMSSAARGRLVGGALDTWGVDVPTSPPQMMPDAGVLDAGKYMAAITYLLADGRESGASALQSITLAASGGISFYGLPIPTQAAVVKKRIYMTTANGETLYRVAECAAADSVAAFESFGAELRTAYLTPPPLGTCIAYTLGRMFIADGKTVWFTEALDLDHCDRRRNFYRFPADVTLIAGAKDGLYVCADRTYFIAAAGTPEANQTAVLGFGAAAGSRAQMPTTEQWMWFSERGAVLAKDGGAVEILAEKRVAPGRMTSAAALVREQDGCRQFIVVGNQAEASTLQCGSYAEAEIIRRAKA